MQQRQAWRQGAVPLFIFLIFLTGGTWADNSGQGLVIVSCEPWFTRVEPPYLKLEIEYPDDWDKAQVDILVNGRTPPSRSLGGGFGGGRRSASFAFFPGEPGRKKIQVRVTSPRGTLTAATEVDFASQGGAEFLHLTDGEAVFQPPQVELFVYLLKDWRLTLNGRPAAVQQVSWPDFPGHCLLRVAGGWQPGANVLEFTGTNRQGREISRRLRVFWVRDGLVRVGDDFLLLLGSMGSKSGPFYGLKLEGSALTAISQKQTEVFVLNQDRWLGMDYRFFREVKVQAPGDGVLTVMVKKHFTLGYEPLRQFRVRAVP